ncbi:hypothetical protein KFE25_010494 [Diacronema lutheri]|uniref:Uncharacterized protein n=1 Tax=Diacronema lutheri TaxID=2081491 RepID=A0A8J5XCV9_DIALT|nr:hypothetical protein KFE25_010494 [Diacronema lutheri]
MESRGWCSWLLSLWLIRTDGLFLGASPASRASAELQRRLIDGYARSGVQREKPEIDRLVAQLASASVRFDRRALDGELWCVAWMSGPRPRWSVGRAQQVAGQRYDLTRGAATNYAELFGRALSIVADADLCEADARVLRCPKDFELQVSSARILLGPSISLGVPIRGRGVARLLYADARVRLFVSPSESQSQWEANGLIIAQVPARALFGEGWEQPAALRRP